MRDVKTFVRAHLSSLALPPHREIQIVDELTAQLEDSYESLLASGLPEDEAWEELQRQMPDGESLARELRDADQPARALTAVREFFGIGGVRDLRSGARLLLRDRGFTATTVLTLAICLGANAAIFTVVNSVLLRPLPVPGADRIVAMGDVYPTITPDDILSNTAPAYIDRLEAVTTLEEQALFTLWFDTITIDGVSEELRGMRATPSLFRLLRVQPALGRTFTEAEGEIGAERKIILSHGLWQRLYGGDPGAIGRDVRLGWTGERYTIVGVMPRGFSFFDRGDDGHARAAGDGFQFWIPLAFTPAQLSDDARTRYGYFHIGRMHPDAGIEQVQAQVDALNAAMFKRFPQFDFDGLGMYTAVTPLQEALTRGVRDTLYLLWGGAAFVLLIGALNIANLSLARASARTRELATRLALGAGRVRVTRQLIVEGLLLAAAGGAASAVVGSWILRTLTSSGMPQIPNAAAVEMDGTVACYIGAVAAAVGVLVGLVPAAMLGGANINQVLADGNRLGTGSRATRLFRRALVVAQVALSVVLLIGAGLLLTSFRNLLAVDGGFVADRVMTATIFPPPSRYTDERAIAALSDRLLSTVRELPGVEAAGVTSNIALSGRPSPATVFPVDRPPRPGDQLVLPSVVSITPGYFEAMTTPIVRGRYFAETDRANAPRVAIVDGRLAARLWPGEDPIGKRLQRGDSEPYTVVGVVRDVRFEGLDAGADSPGAAYFPHTQTPPVGRLRWIAIRTANAQVDVIPSLRSALMAIDPGLPLSDIQTMTERTSSSVVPQKLAMGLAGMFGVVALFLSAVGIYGVLTYVVARRTREIGIRIALGSTARGVFGLVFREGVMLITAGLALGLAGAVSLGRALEGQVFGVTPTDPVVLGAVALGTAVVALVACVSPAWSATHVDPLNILSEQ